MFTSYKSSHHRRHCLLRGRSRRRRSFISVVAMVMSLLLLCQMATPVEAKKNKKDKGDKKNRIKTKNDKNSKWKGGLEELLESTSESATTIIDDAVDPILVDDTDMKFAETNDISSLFNKKKDDQIAPDEDATIDGSDSAKSSSKKSKNDSDKDDDIVLHIDQASTIDIDDDDDKSSKSDKNKNKKQNKGQSSDQVNDVDEDSVSLDVDSTTATRTDCVQCTNIPSHKMMALGQDCTSVPHLAFRCSRRNFVRHHFCAKSCFETGDTGYAAMNCCNSSTSTTDNEETNANIIIDSRGDDGEGTSEEPVVDSSTTSQPTTSRSSNVLTTSSPTLSPNPMPTTRSSTPGPTTSTPTMSPSRLPSNIPTIEESNVPSTKPSAAPTTLSPSSSPSKIFSGQPSAAPTHTPTDIPTSSSPTMVPSRSPSTKPSAQPSARPSSSPADFVEVDDSSNCVHCSDEATPWMKDNNKTCAQWPLTEDRCSTTYWLNKQFCSQTCAEKGKAYEGTNCCVDKEDNPNPDATADCVACTDVESGWMTANGFGCATWKGLKGKCGPNGATQSFIDSKFCAHSCFERYGISYLDSDGNEERCCEA